MANKFELLEEQLACLDNILVALKETPDDNSKEYLALQSVRQSVVQVFAFDQLVNTLARRAGCYDWQRDQMKQSAIDATYTLLAPQPRKYKKGR